MPEYLDRIVGAKDIWFEEIERVVAHGVTADHSSSFARYCCLEWLCRQAFAAAQVPAAATLSEVRKLAEMLGIVGLAGRTSNGQQGPALAQHNPYADLPGE